MLDGYYPPVIRFYPTPMANRTQWGATIPQAGKKNLQGSDDCPTAADVNNACVERALACGVG
jgi:hypothetical protein